MFSLLISNTAAPFPETIKMGSANWCILLVKHLAENQLKRSVSVLTRIVQTIISLVLILLWSIAWRHWLDGEDEGHHWCTEGSSQAIINARRKAQNRDWCCKLITVWTWLKTIRVHLALFNSSHTLMNWNSITLVHFYDSCNFANNSN